MNLHINSLFYRTGHCWTHCVCIDSAEIQHHVVVFQCVHLYRPALGQIQFVHKRHWGDSRGPADLEPVHRGLLHLSASHDSLNHWMSDRKVSSIMSLFVFWEYCVFTRKSGSFFFALVLSGGTFTCTPSIVKELVVWLGRRHAVILMVQGSNPCSAYVELGVLFF